MSSIIAIPIYEDAGGRNGPWGTTTKSSITTSGKWKDYCAGRKLGLQNEDHFALLGHAALLDDVEVDSAGHPGAAGIR